MKKSLLALFSFIFFGIPVSFADVVEIYDTESCTNIPFSIKNKYSLTQFLYLKSELGSAEAGTITELAFKYNSSSHKGVDWNVDIYMSHSNLTKVSGFTNVSSSNKVYSGSISRTISGWYTITLTTPFEWDGVNNILITVDDNTGSWGANSDVNHYGLNTNSYFNKRSVAIFGDVTNYDPTAATSIAGSTTYQYYPSIRFTFSTGTAPATPDDMKASSTTINSAILSWTAVAGATSYKLQYSADGISDWSDLATPSTNSYEWTGLSENTTYHARIAASNSTGDSDWSDAVSFTTDAVHTHNGITFSKWDATEAMPTSGNYYLAYDVTIGGTARKSISSTLNLCLNGHTITFGSYTGLDIVDGGSVALYDNIGGGLITGSNGASTISVASGGRLTIHAGDITNTGSGYPVSNSGILDINLTDASSNATNLAIANGTVNVSMTRSLTSSQYNTFCLPFALTDAQLQEYFGAGYDLEEFVSSSLEDDVLNLSFERKYALEAGKPYLLQPSVNVANPSFEGVTIAATSPADQTSDSHISFHGTFAPTELAGGNKNLLFLGAGNELFWPASTGNIKAFRAYFEVKGAAQKAAKRARIVQKENTTTGVDQVSAQFGESDKLLRNGQLLIIRDNKIYNVLGQPVQL